MLVYGNRAVLVMRQVLEHPKVERLLEAKNLLCKRYQDLFLSLDVRGRTIAQCYDDS